MLPIMHNYITREVNEEQEQQDGARQLLVRRRMLRVSSSSFALPDARFIELFRLNKDLTRNLMNALEPHLRLPKYRSGISIETKVFAALRFYATACYQLSIGVDYNLGLSQTSVHRCIHEVTAAIIDTFLTPAYIVFPQFNDLSANKEQFMRKFKIPGVIGAIDCTHISILKPNVEEHNFINRKGYHSLNAQITCDANLKILNVNANFPGSTHDAFIWRQSSVKEYLHGLYRSGSRGFWLIGDSGYPLEPYLMTPFSGPRPGIRRNLVQQCPHESKTLC